MWLIHLNLLILVVNSNIVNGVKSKMYSFNNEWVVKILGGPEKAKSLSDELGYSYQGAVLGFEDTYLFTTKLHPVYQKRGFNKLSKQLHEDSRVLWAEKQQIKSRQKRDLKENLPFNSTKSVVKRNTKTGRIFFNDELWSQEWYLQDTRTRLDLPKLDLNVLPVYRAGITGKGVRVTILDDGIEYNHEDLKSNYDPDISWDCNENDADPMPNYDARRRNSHGTRCAGEVAMVADNGKCGVGVAYNAKIGGVKMLDGFVNDRIEGTALGFAYNLVDIYSASWGPNDDGQTVDGPGTLATQAIERGIQKGRNGLGSIYVWASGNGGKKNDNCNCDGYIASRYTIAIGSASQRGEFPWYGEQCAATIAVTYSSGAYKDQMIATTDLRNKCTIKHTGTSASAPLAAGIIALALEANPKLTWRDIQHLIIWTSEYFPVSDNPGWNKNGGGLWFSTKFGFGLMNAHSLVETAQNWTTVPEAISCTTYKKFNATITSRNRVKITFETSHCHVRYLEHVEITTNIQYSFRGDLEVYLKSAAGTKVQILGTRKLDNSQKGFSNWTFMSVMTWSENPIGFWTLEVKDKNIYRNNSGTIGDTWLKIYGTKTIPTHMLNGPRKYNENYNRIHKKFYNYYDYLYDYLY